MIIKEWTKYYEVHSDCNENNIHELFLNKDEAIKYAKNNSFDETFVEEHDAYIEHDEKDIIEIIDEEYQNNYVIWAYNDEDEEEDIIEDDRTNCYDLDKEDLDELN